MVINKKAMVAMTDTQLEKLHDEKLERVLYTIDKGLEVFFKTEKHDGNKMALINLYRQCLCDAAEATLEYQSVCRFIKGRAKEA